MTLSPSAVEELLALVRRAGQRVLAMQPSIEAEYKADGSPCTQADLEANHIISAGLKTLTPNIPIVAEENDADRNAEIIEQQADYWLVDPLDVTINYMHGGKEFSINVALVQAHVPVLGVLYFPALEELYYTGADGNAYMQRGDAVATPVQMLPFSTKRRDRQAFSSPMVVAMRGAEGEDLPYTSKQHIQTIITAGQHRACMVVAGKALISSERAGFRVWDSAPTYAIVCAAGGDMRQNDGHTLCFKDKMALPAYTVGHPSLLDRIVPPVATDGDVI